ncbi:MAG: ribosomal-processing cysteine protease Prp [Ruminococcus sp.]
MTNICFIKSQGLITGFRLDGHSGFAAEGEDIICAAISSAAYMTVNTITDVIGLDADTRVADGLLSMELSPRIAPEAQDILNGFLLHIKELSKEYPNNITVIITEV